MMQDVTTDAFTMTADTGAAERGRSRLSRWSGYVLWVTLAMIALAEAFAAWWPDDLQDSSRVEELLAAGKFVLAVLPVHFAIVCGGVALLGMLLRRWRLVATSAGLGLILLAWAYPPLWASARPAGDGPTLRVMSANLYFRNETPQALLAAVDALEPDVLLLQEYTPAHDAVLRQALQDRLPHAIVQPIDNPDGIASFSHLPITEVALPPGLDRKAQRFTLDHAGQRVTVFNVHPASPGGLAGKRSNRRENGALADLAADTSGPVIVAGDFNAPPTSASLAAYDDVALLSAHAMTGHGFGHTWPLGRLPFFTPGVRIDDIRLAPALAATATGLGPPTGSDHRPIWADVTFATE